MPKISDKKIVEEIEEEILSARNKNEAYEAIWGSFYDNDAKCDKACGRGVKILILNAPCHGFGDIIFAMKLAGYLRQWYDAKVTIATTMPDGFKKLGESGDNLVSLGGGGPQCRRFSRLEMDRDLPQQDLVFVAPLQADLSVKMSDVRNLVPYANKLNTFFFSEYNDSAKKKFDFPSGVGKENMGLMMIDTKSGGRLPKLKNPYALVYIAETIPASDNCFMAFLEMVTAKYSYKKFDVVVPKWISDSTSFDKRIKNRVVEYGTIAVVNSSGETRYIRKLGSNTLTLRGDVLPVPNKEMISVMKHSVRDILLTGDQSITDALSCCPGKNIFYQIAPWKESFGNELAKHLPNKYLKRKKTSCGTLMAIRYDSNYKKFVEKWDFRKMARPKMDAVVRSAIAIKKNKDVAELADIILRSKKLRTMKDKVEALE